MLKIKVVAGDIVQIEADGIITPINSQELWFGGIDRAIQSVAGELYHNQARKLPLSNLMTVAAKGDQSQHQGKFDHVIFVVDDLVSTLDQVVMTGLEAANLAELKSVLIPSMRTGVMQGIVESSLAEVADNLIFGINEHFNDFPDSTIESVTVVVYNNPMFEAAITERISAK